MNSTPESIEKITAIIMSGGALIAYILAEGYIDGKREGVQIVMVDESCDDVE